VAAPIKVLTPPPYNVNTDIAFKISAGDVVGWAVEGVDVNPPVAVIVAGVINPSNVVTLGPWPAVGEYRVTVSNNTKNPPSTTVTIV
jgi:hypothetical protein